MSKPKHFVIASLLGLILVIMLPTCGIRTNPVLTSIPPPVGTLAILTPTQTTHTATPPPATSALSAFPDTSAFERLPFSFQDRALPSPDGHLIATTQTLNLVVYDLQGNLIGHSAAPNQRLFNALWLDDSSALLFWQGGCGPSSKLPDPILIMDRQGHTRPTGLKGCDPVPSTYGEWLAAEWDDAASGETLIDVVPREGGNTPTLVRGKQVNLLGWQADQVLYYDAGAIYTFSLTGIGRHKILSLPPDEDLAQPIFGSSTSPDGQVLVLFQSQRKSVILAQGKLRAAPPSELIWRGPHDALDLTSDGGLVIVDMVSGAAVRHLGIRIQGVPYAVSDSWLAWPQYGDQTLHLTNLDNGVERNLGDCPACGDVSSLGQGRFLIHALGGSKSFLLDSSLSSH